MEITQLGAMAAQREITAVRAEPNIQNFQIHLRRTAISNSAPPNIGEDLLNILVFHTQNRSSIEWHLVYELGKSGLNFFERGIVVQMFSIDICDNGQNRREFEERSITLIRLNDEKRTLPHTRVRTLHGGDASTYHNGWVEIRRIQNGSNH